MLLKVKIKPLVLDCRWSLEGPCPPVPTFGFSLQTNSAQPKCFFFFFCKHDSAVTHIFMLSYLFNTNTPILTRTLLNTVWIFTYFCATEFLLKTDTLFKATRQCYKYTYCNQHRTLFNKVKFQSPLSFLCYSVNTIAKEVGALELFLLMITQAQWAIGQSYEQMAMAVPR